MATEANKARRQAEAEDVINTHVSALAAKFNVEMPDAVPVRDVEMKRLIGLEKLGETLGLIVEKINEKEIQENQKEKVKRK